MTESQRIPLPSGLPKQFSDGRAGVQRLHAALASLDDPPRDLRRRLWSAQASVLLPSIAGWRWDLLLQHRALIAEHLTREG